LISLMAAIIILVAVLAFTMNRLKIYTHHGISYQVPDLSGLTFKQAENVAEETLLKIEMLDSVYNKNAEPGTVVDQVPKHNKRVKEGRVIFVTMNAMEPEKVEAPRLTDISFRQAQVLLENSGLFIDSIIYEPSEYDDLVLSVLQNSEAIKEGDRLVRGSAVVLVVGQSKGNMGTVLPQLYGMFIDDAKARLTDARLNLGVVIYDNTIKTQDDSLNARVWKQMPDADVVNNVYQGSSVDLWLTVDDEKLKTNEFQQ
jgi:beta-lactam-binding protein with PASTA domain